MLRLAQAQSREVGQEGADVVVGVPRLLVVGERELRGAPPAREEARR